MPLDNQPKMILPVMNQSEDKSLLEQVTLDLARGEKLLEKGTIPRGILEMWIRPLRYKFKKIYGDSVPINNFFKDPPQGQSSGNYSAILKRLLIQTNKFLFEAQQAFRVSYNDDQGKVFIGHGRSPVWREFKDFIADRLGLPWDEFNRDPIAGMMTFERLSSMLSSASFAFLVMTAEDQYADSTLHARENVIHEVGLFQGKLGRLKAIILLEEGCHEFSNVSGLTLIPFPKGRPAAAFEEIRKVLERERLLET